MNIDKIEVIEINEYYLRNYKYKLFLIISIKKNLFNL